MEVLFPAFGPALGTYFKINLEIRQLTAIAVLKKKTNKKNKMAKRRKDIDLFADILAWPFLRWTFNRKIDLVRPTPTLAS